MTGDLHCWKGSSVSEGYCFRYFTIDSSSCCCNNIFYIWIFIIELSLNYFYFSISFLVYHPGRNISKTFLCLIWQNYWLL